MFVVFLSLLIAVQARDYYGRAFGSVASWNRVDKGESHHLEVSFNSMPGYSSFTANIDIESRSGSGLYVSSLTGSGSLAKILPLITGLNNTGVKSLSSGVTYCGWLQQGQFTQMSESSYVRMLESMLGRSKYVFFFGQVYTDNGNGIHDIHRIDNSPGDGGLVILDGSGHYSGVFAYFADQSICGGK